MKFSLMVFVSLFMVACSSKPVILKNSVSELYEQNANSVCPDITEQASTRKEAAYCLGRIYLHETDRKVPKLDQLAFRDVKAGDPTIPYLWIVVSHGIMKPDSHQEFGLVREISKNEWESSLEILKAQIKEWRKNSLSLRLKE